MGDFYYYYLLDAVLLFVFCRILCSVSLHYYLHSIDGLFYIELCFNVLKRITDMIAGLKQGM